MKRRSRFAVIGIILATMVTIIVVFVFHSMAFPKNSARERLRKAADREMKASPPAPENEEHGTTAEEAASLEKLRNFSFQISGEELSRLRVLLPEPVNKPWTGPFFNSTNCFDPDKKLAAVSVLPLWIRQTVAVGATDLASRYLWTLIRFTDDQNLEVQNSAVLSLYRLGDSNKVATQHMLHWMESGDERRDFDRDYGHTVSKNICAIVLKELDFYHDQSLDGAIYKLWFDGKDREGERVASVDYAYYLETHGRQLPDEYWLQRLDNRYGFDQALEMTEKKGIPETTAKLQPLFEDLRAKSGGQNANPGKAAVVASALFRMTGDVHYRDYLVEEAQARISRESYDHGFKEILEALAASKDGAALEIVLSAAGQARPGIQGTIIDALGKSRDPAATEWLFESAVQKAEQGKGFPAHELWGLLAQNNPSAEAKYERLKQALLSGKLAWTAATSDFEAMDFFRKHGRQ
ncbi:MAG: hypothetical protein ABIP85_25710 [Chthoniobacteraceae bacterium]